MTGSGCTTICLAGFAPIAGILARRYKLFLMCFYRFIQPGFCPFSVQSDRLSGNGHDFAR
jgi:hypothetical protein